MAVDEGKWFSKMLASRKTFAEYTKLNKRPLYPVILSKILCKSASISRLCGMENMLNEPNPVLSEVEWISKIAHLINEQRTMPVLSSVEGNYELLSNEPNLSNILSIYAIGCSLDGKYLGVLGALGGYKQKISNFGLGFNQSMKKMQNEPNLQNAKINLVLCNN